MGDGEEGMVMKIETLANTGEIVYKCSPAHWEARGVNDKQLVFQ